MKPALIVHGGAWRIADDLHATHLNGVQTAARAAWDMLQSGSSALDAIEQAIVLMEDNHSFDAGIGSVLNRNGQIELDAMIMDGHTLSMGAVAAVQNVQNPIRLARRLMNEPEYNMLAADGARQYAEAQGIPLVSQDVLELPREVERLRQYEANPPAVIAEFYAAVQSGGTVGAVAMDIDGNIAAGTSTGGASFKLPGRVGDSPLVGSGTYADNQTGGVSSTGHGERIMRVVLAKYATDLIRQGRNAQQAADEAIQHLYERVQGRGGIILIDRDGNVGFAHNTPHMAVAWIDEHGELRSYLQPES